MLFEIYNLLPGAGRSVAASMRGYYLRWWRYGKETEQWIEEAAEREGWSLKRWKEWQEEQLRQVLWLAMHHVPYYRQHWSERRRRGDRSSWEELGNWPVLEKKELRSAPGAFVADNCPPSRLFREWTSGTTGTPVVLWKSKETLRKLYALSELRERRWYGVSRRDGWAILGGQPVVPMKNRRGPFWVWNAGMNQLYMSTYHLAADLVGEYVRAFREYNIVYILGYTSSLCVLAKEILRLGLDVRMRVVITNAEPLFSEQRNVIGRAFQCPVRETYGMCENVLAASECECGELHLWPEIGWPEVRDEEPGVRGEGELICTGFLNREMPLIRYAVGDRVNRAGAQEDCRCGRTLPLLGKVEGRTSDLVRTADGRRIYWLNPVFYELPVQESQIIQEDLRQFHVRIVPANGFHTGTEKVIRKRLQERVGEGEVTLELMERIPRSANGKFRAVICKCP